MPRLHDSIHAADYALAGCVEFQGLRICIENKKGQIRKGVGANGKPWAVKMPFDYGYIGNTKGNDGEHVDCYIGPSKDAEYVFVVHQSKEQDKSAWDEDKVMLGFDTADAAIKAYKSAYVGVDLFQSMTILPMDAFKKALRSKKIKLSAGGPGSGRHKESEQAKLPAIKWKKLSEGWNPKLIRHNYISMKDIVVTQKYRSRKIVQEYVDKIKAGEPLEPLMVSRIGDQPDKFTFTGFGGNHRFAALKKLGYTNIVIPVLENNYGHIDDHPANPKPKDLNIESYGMAVGEDYHQFREGVAMQPQTRNHPPSLKNPMKVPVDNPDDPEDKYGDRKKRRSKNTKKIIREMARRQSGKPEIVNTTMFVPFNMG